MASPPPPPGSFALVNVHVLNLPMALLTTLAGGAAAGSRALHAADLWVSLLVMLCYGLIYFFLLDRLGLHYYPIFSPRTHWSALGYAVIVILFFGCWRGWAAIIRL